MHDFIALVLGRLLATSIHAVLLATLVWILCRSLRRLPPAAQCWLWWLVALQALVGLCVDPVQLPWLPQAAPLSLEVAPSFDMALPASGAVMQPAVVHSAAPWQLIVFLIWAGGFATFSALTLWQWRRARELLRTSLPCEDVQLLQSLAQAAESCGLRRLPDMALSASIDSPALVGHFRPVLLLPFRERLSGEELDMAIAHELTHLRRGDLWGGCVPALARHLFFFHPFVHLAVREYGIAREADCDANVVAAERHSRHDYGDLLLRLGTRSRSGAELAVASPTFHALSRRLTMLQNITFLSRKGSIALVIIVAAIGVMPLRLVAAAAAPVAPATGAAPPVTRAAAKAEERTGTAAAAQKSAVKKEPVASVAPAPARNGRGITSIDFRRAGPGSATGRLVIALSDARIPVKLTQQGSSVVVEFTGADLPDNLQRSYDVSDFGTAVTGIDARRTSGGSKLDISAQGDVEHLAYWAGGQYVVEIQPRGQRQVQEQVMAPEQPVYTGKRMTASFQDIPVRTLLQLISEASGRNITVDDGVTGNVTLSLKDVPWDQVLDIVLKTRGLEKRVQGDVIWVLPAGAQASQQKVSAPMPASGAMQVTGGSLSVSPYSSEVTCGGGCRISLAPGEEFEGSSSQVSADKNAGITYMSGGVRLTFRSGSQLRAEALTIRKVADGAQEISGDEIRIVRAASL